MTISLIAGMAKNRTIGKNNKLPWNYPEDLQYFKKTTNGHPIVMGLKTYNSIGRPLPNRRNLVLTRQNIQIDGVEIFHSITELQEKLKSINDEIFVIGGANIYSQFLPLANKIYLTEIKKEYEGDTFFPKFEEDFIEISREKHEELDFVIYQRK
ncbi:MAG TPA: dihydrofolate reductase [Candidatus Absconditabacterales bacterium]|nr:dihydrofolate reductase [Candidatus Absconditabacterales bacterium]